MRDSQLVEGARPTTLEPTNGKRRLRPSKPKVDRQTSTLPCEFPVGPPTSNPSVDKDDCAKKDRNMAKFLSSRDMLGRAVVKLGATVCSRTHPRATVNARMLLSASRGTSWNCSADLYSGMAHLRGELAHGRPLSRKAIEKTHSINSGPRRLTCDPCQTGLLQPRFTTSAKKWAASTLKCVRADFWTSRTWPKTSDIDRTAKSIVQKCSNSGANIFPTRPC